MPLSYLSLYYCSNITDVGLLYLSNTCTNEDINKKAKANAKAKTGMMTLEHLDLRMCRKITDDGIMYLKKLPLKHINICNYYNVTSIGYSYLENVEDVQSPLH